jgi:hypothetical protein
MLFPKVLGLGTLNEDRNMWRLFGGDLVETWALFWLILRSPPSLHIRIWFLTLRSRLERFLTAAALPRLASPARLVPACPTSHGCRPRPRPRMDFAHPRCVSHLTRMKSVSKFSRDLGVAACVTDRVTQRFKIRYLSWAVCTPIHLGRLLVGHASSDTLIYPLLVWNYSHWTSQYIVSTFGDTL